MFQLYYKFLLLFSILSFARAVSGFRRFSNGSFPESFKWLHRSFRRVSKRFKGFLNGFKRASKGFPNSSIKPFQASFERVLKCLKGSQRALKGKTVLKGFQTLWHRVSKGFQSDLSPTPLKKIALWIRRWQHAFLSTSIAFYDISVWAQRELNYLQLQCNFLR